jgi:hypothetical protein
MFEQQQRANQQDNASEAPVAHDPVAAVEAQPQTHQAPPAASFSELTGSSRASTETAASAPAQQAPLANTDAMIEQLSHGMVAKELDDKDQEFLAANGYSAQPIMRGIHDFVMRTFLPTVAGKPPIVAFRGTVPSKPQTIIADLDPTGIGMYQFNPNKNMIDQQMMMAATHGAIISTGHSLGGALAQIAAATFPDRVGRIVTFQAPGVSKDMAKKLVEYNEANPDHAIESTHHRVEGDLVPNGGEALTPGVVVNHKMTGGSALSRNPLSKHVSMPLAQEEVEAGHDVPIHNDAHGSQETGVYSTDQENADKSQISEKIRTGLGKLVYGLGRLQP